MFCEIEEKCAKRPQIGRLFFTVWRSFLPQGRGRGMTDFLFFKVGPWQIKMFPEWAWQFLFFQGGTWQNYFFTLVGAAKYFFLQKTPCPPSPWYQMVHPLASSQLSTCHQFVSNQPKVISNQWSVTGDSNHWSVISSYHWSVISSYHWSVVNYCSVDSMADPGGASVAAAPSGGTAPDFFLGGGKYIFQGGKGEKCPRRKMCVFWAEKVLKNEFLSFMWIVLCCVKLKREMYKIWHIKGPFIISTGGGGGHIVFHFKIINLCALSSM